ncbi:MAG: sulfotransferase [Bacteroidota bacterium]
MPVNFIGVGAQRTASSWLYSCLYEHPDICAPQKEIHFFSRPRYKEQGIEWYKNIFESRCTSGQVCGEFSTSYLVHELAAERISHHIPDTKILIILRNPVDRAFSQYLLHGKVGWLDPTQTTFKDFMETEPSAEMQSRYALQLQRFYDRFPRECIHVMLYEDIETDPERVLLDVFTFLGVDPDFTPSFTHRVVNSGNRPKRLWVSQLMQQVSHFLYSTGFDRVVFAVKKSGLPALIRRGNSAGKAPDPSIEYYESLKESFAEDVSKAGEITGLPLSERWGYTQ